MSYQTPKCPGCASPLTLTSDGELDTWQCPMLHGSAMTLSEAHGRLQDDEIDQLWQSTRAASPGAGARPCPMCETGMRAVLVAPDAGEEPNDQAVEPASEIAVWLDVCESCQVIWFDAGELADFPLNMPNPPVSEEERRTVEMVTRQFGEAMVAASEEREADSFTEKVYRTVAKNPRLLRSLSTVGRVGRQ